MTVLFGAGVSVASARPALATTGFTGAFLDSESLDFVGDGAHYSFSDVLFSGLTGELPDRTSSQRFNLALLASATTSVAEAPTHVALLGRTALRNEDAGTRAAGDEAAFAAAVADAKANCPVSKALAAVPITVDATLA